MNILFSKEENKEIYVSCCVIFTLGFMLDRSESLLISNLIKANNWNLLFQKIGWSKTVKNAIDFNYNKGPAYSALICLKKYFPYEMYRLTPDHKEDLMEKLKEYCLNLDDSWRFIERMASKLIEAHCASNWGSCSIKVSIDESLRFGLKEGSINLLSKTLFDVGLFKSAVVECTTNGVASIKIKK